MFMFGRNRNARLSAGASLLLVLLTFPVLRASEVQVLPVGPFGQPLKDCTVTGLRPYSAEAGPVRDLKDRFKGMTGRDIPYGNYELAVNCGTRRLADRIAVDRSQQLIVVAQYVGMMYEGDGPTLLVTIDPPGRGDDMVYWVELLGVYNGTHYTASINRQTSANELRVPPTGSYLVLLLSSGGYQCSREVDLVQFTRHWAFRRRDCSLDVDRFAHVVSLSDTANHRQGGWYRSMQTEQERLERTLTEASKGTEQENTGKH